MGHGRKLLVKCATGTSLELHTFLVDKKTVENCQRQAFSVQVCWNNLIAFHACAGDNDRQRAVPVSGDDVPAVVRRHGVVRHPRDVLQLHHEVRRRHPQGPLRQHGPVWRHHHVPGHRRPHAEGDHGSGAGHDEDQDHRSTRTQVLGVDRRLHPRVAVHVPADVDQQAGIRRVRAINRAPQMLLDWWPLWHAYCHNVSWE